MTRLPKPGRSPSSDSRPRRRARTREIPSGSSASHFPGRRQPLAVAQSSAWGAEQAYLFVCLFILFFSFFFFSPARKTLSTHSGSPVRALPWGCGESLGFCFSIFQALWVSRESFWHGSCPSSRASVSPSGAEWRFPHRGAGQGLLQVAL